MPRSARTDGSLPRWLVAAMLAVSAGASAAVVARDQRTDAGLAAGVVGAALIFALLWLLATGSRVHNRWSSALHRPRSWRSRLGGTMVALWVPVLVLSAPVAVDLAERTAPVIAYPAMILVVMLWGEVGAALAFPPRDQWGGA